jgi:hypothetical protein
MDFGGALKGGAIGAGFGGMGAGLGAIGGGTDWGRNLLFGQDAQASPYGQMQPMQTPQPQYANPYYNQSGVSALEGKALQQGPSAWANLMQQKQGIEQGAQRENIDQSFAGQLAQAMQTQKLSSIPLESQAIMVAPTNGVQTILQVFQRVSALLEFQWMVKRRLCSGELQSMQVTGNLLTLRRVLMPRMKFLPVLTCLDTL